MLRLIMSAVLVVLVLAPAAAPCVCADEAGRPAACCCFATDPAADAVRRPCCDRPCDVDEGVALVRASQPSTPMPDMAGAALPADERWGVVAPRVALWIRVADASALRRRPPPLFLANASFLI